MCLCKNKKKIEKHYKIYYNILVFNIQLFFNNIILTKQFPTFWEIFRKFEKNAVC